MGADKHQDGHQGSDQPHGQGQKQIGLANLPPVADQAGGLDHRLHPGVGQDAQGDTGHEVAIIYA